jgi:hypothetical protein
VGHELVLDPRRGLGKRVQEGERALRVVGGLLVAVVAQRGLRDLA